MPFPALDHAAVRWSALVRAGDGTVLFAHDAERMLPAASIGKLALLLAVARGIAHGTLDASEPLTRTADDAVTDSGLWQHLNVDTLTLGDAAGLVGIASDNLATNVLLRRLGGAAAVQRASGLAGVQLHDRVRDVRGAEHPATLSTASARGCVDAWDALDAVAGGRELLTGGLDLSMVAGAFGLDPLAHAASDRGWSVAHKTGTDLGVRADTGVVTGPGGRATYAVLAHWEPADAADPQRDEVLHTMRGIGEALRAALG